jgi:hypothetical protein
VGQKTPITGMLIGINRPIQIAIKIKLVQNYLRENNLSKIKERK